MNTQMVRESFIFPASYAQQRLWFLDQLEPGNPAYNMPAVVHLTGRLNVRALEDALNAIIDRHEILRTTFAAIDGQPSQLVGGSYRVSLECEDLRGGEGKEGEIKRIAAEEARAPFDLSKLPLLRTRLLRVADAEHVLLLTLHHIICDGWSVAILVGELGALYESFCAGNQASLPELPIQYADFGIWQKELLEDNTFRSQLDYWKQKLSGSPALLQLPTDYQRPAIQSFSGGKEVFSLSPPLTEKLMALSRQSGGTLFMTLLSAFKLLLHRYTGQQDIVVGTPIAGRNRIETEPLIGLFLNMLALRTDLSGAPTFRDLLRRVRQASLEAYANQDVPFEKLLEELQPERSLSHPPLFQVLFNMLNFSASKIQLPDLRVEIDAPPEAESKFDLTLYAKEEAEGIRLELVYNADLFSRPRMAEMLEQFNWLLTQVAADPDLRIDAVSLVTRGMAGILPNPADRLSWRWASSICHVFSDRARQCPSDVAVIDKSASLTYGELEQVSTRLASRLRDSGIGGQSVVAVHADRSASLVVALLSVMKSGAAFMILDPAYPPSRLLSSVETARPDGWIQVGSSEPLHDSLREFIDAHPFKCKLDLSQGDPSHRPADQTEAEIGPDDLAYIAFTSGSSGEPKAIIGTHAPLSHFLEWHAETFGLRAADRFSMLSGLSHDPLLRDIFTPLWIGATLCIPDSETIHSPGSLAGWMREQEISVAHLTPAMLDLASQGAVEAPGPDSEGGHLPALRYAFFGGDLLTSQDYERLKGMAPSAMCVNFYGATETPQAVGYFVVEDGSQPVGRKRSTVPLGRGIDGVQLLVLNAAGQLAGTGELGEINVRTPYLSKGYLRDDSATARQFVTNPFTRMEGDRLYKTGDLGRYLPDGNVEFVSRNDRQVKVRGFRVELAEVEASLEQLAGVRQAIVLAPADGPGPRSLVCYAAADDSAGLTARDLRDWLKHKLPDYMIPSSFVMLESLPLTPNGKVDIKSLPAPEPGASTQDEQSRPRGHIEELIAQIWSEVLGRGPVGIHDNFFELGGHSLLATQLIARLRQAFRLDVPLRSLFQSPTVAGLADAVRRMKAGQSEPQATELTFPAIEPAPYEEVAFPLTDIQQAYWIGRIGAIELGNVASHRYLELEIVGLDLPRFANAWNRLIRRHGMLRAVVLPDGTQQILRTVPDYEIRQADLRGQQPDRIDSYLEEVRYGLSHQMLASNQWPLFEIKATLLDGDRTRLHFSFDYLIADARSFQIMFQELARLYEDEQAALSDLHLSFRDYVLAELGLRETRPYRQSFEYWSRRLAALPPPPELPLARSPGSLERSRFVRRGWRMEPRQWRALKSRAMRSGLTPSGLLLACFAEVLKVWSKNPRFTLVLTLFNRLPLHPQVNDLVGDFTSTTLLAVEPERGEFQDRARRLQEQLWSDLDHRYVSGVQVLRELSRLRGGGIRAAMPVVFTSTLMQGGPDHYSSKFGSKTELVYGISQTPQVWLDHQVSEQGEALVCTWDALEELFPGGMLDDMFASYCGLVTRLADDERIWHETDIPLVPSYQLEQRAAVNATEAPTPVEMLHTPHPSTVTQPTRPAIISPTRVLTYGEVAGLSNQIGRRLKDLGAWPGKLVAIVMEKGWEQVVAALGILQSGAAYLPIDAALPRDRLRYLLENAEVEVALTQSAQRGRLDWPPGVNVLSVDAEDWGSADDGPVAPAQTQDDLAYVIYTSGSTGFPKGVMIDHRGAVNTVVDINTRFNVTADDRVLALSSLSFDLSVYDIFGMLKSGGAVVMPDASELRNPEHWSELIEREKVTIWNTVPALMEMLTRHLAGAGKRLPQSLRLVMLSGDWVPLALPDQIKALADGVEVVSLGGATEASIWSILYPVERTAREWKSIPYGRPMKNQTFHVLDDSLMPRPVYVPGQLYIGGVGLARGYWRDEEKTRDSFIHHPKSGERLYRTGDLGCYLPDGNIEFLGRQDFQVKVQGYRIELAEIEAVLAQHAGVRMGVVAALGDLRGSKRLVAYVVPDEESPPTAGELQGLLREKLPEYMVPSAIVMMDSLPLTDNGKVDRRALPAPEDVRSEWGDNFIAPRTPVEETLAELYTRILGVERVGVEDDFFAVGGNSLHAIHLVSQIREAFHIDLPLRAVFENPTVSGLAVTVLQAQGEELGEDEMASLLEELDRLSADEAQKMLAAEDAVDGGEPSATQ